MGHVCYKCIPFFLKATRGARYCHVARGAEKLWQELHKYKVLAQQPVLCGALLFCLVRACAVV